MPFPEFHSEALGLFSSFLASCTWAVGATVYASLSIKYSGPAVNFCRALVAFPLFCMALYFFHQGQGTILQEFLVLPISRWGWFLASVMGSFALGDTLFLLSTRSLGVPSALAISSIYPIWSALAGWIFLGNTFYPAKGLGVFLVVAGTVVIILHKRRQLIKAAETRNSKPAPKFWTGVLLAFLTSLFWALNSFSLAVGGEGLSPLFANVVRTFLCLVLCPVVGLFLYRGAFRLIPFQDAKKNIWVFVVEAFAGSLFFIYGLNHSPLATAAALSSLAPVLALCLAWALRKEKVSLITSFSLATVIVGIWLLVGLQP